MIRKLLNRLFEREEINGNERCPTYMYRWTLFRTQWGKLYLHKFVGDDWSTDLHDHPKAFVSIGVSGSYLERTPDGERLWRAPWIRRFPATHLHRIRTVNAPCYTIVWVGKTEREWGFIHRGAWVPWEIYVRTAPNEVVSCR